MDDIISDLNPGSQAQSQQVAPVEQHSEIPSFRTQQERPQTQTLRSPKGKVAAPRVQNGPAISNQKRNLNAVKSSGYGLRPGSASGSAQPNQKANENKNMKNMQSLSQRREQQFGMKKEKETVGK